MRLQQMNPFGEMWYHTQWFEYMTLKKEFFIEVALDFAEETI